MDYTRLVTKRGQYKYSVNICFVVKAIRKVLYQRTIFIISIMMKKGTWNI